MTAGSSRIQRYIQRNSAHLFFRRPFKIQAARPIISFSFDDFPRSALTAGGSILSERGAAGTFYVSLGLAGQPTVSGIAFEHDDLNSAVSNGHELGCHTFSHCHSWETRAEDFEAALEQNSKAMRELLPQVTFQSFSYPISDPRPFNKRAASKRFQSSRAGGQKPNIGTADLNQLSAFFLEKTKEDIAPVQRVIDQNTKENGWLIFATHDIELNPSPYGCTPSFFRQVVDCAVASGARILPVSGALKELRGLNSSIA